MIPQSDTSGKQLGVSFAGREAGAEKTVEIVTDLYTAEISTRGGLVKKWELHKYKSWDGVPVQLVHAETGGDLSITNNGRR